jgi:hypothetical protein
MPAMTRRPAPAPLVALLVAAACATAAAADDTKLFQESTAEPYVFILLDLSGSMNQSVPCSQQAMEAGECTGVRADVLHANVPCTSADVAAGLCLPCPEGACLPRRLGDDPESKLRVAKEAIYALMEEVDDVHFGFGTFDHDRLRVHRKHWWYRVAETQPEGFIELVSGRTYPPAGQEEVFGKTWNCNRAQADGGANNEALRYVGCRATDPADLDDRWEYERVRRLPKLGEANNRNVGVYVRDEADGQAYFVEYQKVEKVGTGPGAVTQRLGDDVLAVDVLVTCLGACPGYGAPRKRLLFEKVDDMVYWEPGEGVRRDPPGVAFFGSGDFDADEGAGGTRMSVRGGQAGWDPNGDGGEDAYEGQNLRYETQADPRGAALGVGDVVPWDWRDPQRGLLRQRMAPNTALPGWDPASEPPDFQVASYFEDHPTSGRESLRLRAPYLDAGVAPQLGRGGTPTGASMEDFSGWVDDWRAVADGSDTPDPDDGDPSFGCRRQFLLVLTDGLASSGDGTRACDAATELREKDVRSFAVAFGLEETTFAGFQNTLTCIANNGGTGTRRVGGEDVVEGPGPLFPQNKDQLIEALLQVIQLVRPEPRTLTGVAVPSVQAEASDKLFLTDFTPLNRQAVWAGHLHAFAKPLPLDADRKPDFGALCSDLPADEPPSACYLYDAGEVLLREQVLPSTAAPVGNGAAQRRIYRSRFDDSSTVPKERLFLAAPDASTPLSARLDLLAALDLDPAAADADARAAATVAAMLAPRSVVLPDGSTVEYALGDVFHSDPLLVGSPANNLLFLTDAGEDLDRPCGDGNRGYRCFALEHARRRRVLVAGSNDGMLHAFDAGGFVASTDPAVALPLGGSFDDGSGRELFAYVPRPVGATLVEMHESRRHRFTVDGRVAAADVFVDPVHSARAGDPVDPDERQWRTLLVGGLRRGGGPSGDIGLPPLPEPPPLDAGERQRVEEQPLSGYYALDLTRPDPIDPDTLVPDVPPGRQPGCAGDGSGGGLDARCDGAAYGMPRWEFQDSVAGLAADEDGDGFVDLAPTWSRPGLGRIRVCTGDCGGADPVLEDRWVAVFGGGLDPERPERGGWLYMVDVESGRAIYKQPLDGAAASAPAAVDTDLDGYLDRVYLGTVEGSLYRVDLRPRVGGAAAYPELAALDPPLTFEGREVDADGEPLRSVAHAPPRITGARFRPVRLFDAGADDGARRPIFFPPSVFYVPQLSRWAVAFGTGDREDLFAEGGPSGRFFTFVDEVDDLTLLSVPLGPADLLRIDRDAAFDLDTASQPLLDRAEGHRGWWLELAADERLVTPPFALSGILVFSTYQPLGTTAGAAAGLCRELGTSRIFGLLATSGNGIMFSGGSARRYLVVDDFVTAPFTEQAQTKNPPPADGDQATADALSDELRAVMGQLQRLLPRRCSFQEGYRVDIKARSSDTGMIFIAPVPVCVIEEDFREW